MEYLNVIQDIAISSTQNWEFTMIFKVNIAINIFDHMVRPPKILFIDFR